MSSSFQALMFHKVFGLPDWDIVAVFSSWTFYYLMIHGLYYCLGEGMRQFYKKFTNYPTNEVSAEDLKKQIKLSEIAFPLYCLVPVSGDICRRKGVSRICDSVSDCGGWGPSLLNWAVYLFLVEGAVYFVHYWMLHKWVWGKRNMKHSVHHAMKEKEEMTTFSGYAFEAVDGASQGMPFIIGQWLIPIPYIFTIISGLGVGVWTMYIHQSAPRLPWPMMGADFHYIHHRDNWYNFGLFTRFWDWVNGTLKDPLLEKPSKKSDSNKAKSKSVREKSI